MHACMHACMHAWMDGRMDGWMEGWMDGWIKLCIASAGIVCTHGLPIYPEPYSPENH